VIFVSELFKNTKFKTFLYKDFCYLCATSKIEFEEIKHSLNAIKIDDNLLILSKFQRRRAINLGAKEVFNVINIKTKNKNHESYKVYKRKKVFFLLPWL